MSLGIVTIVVGLVCLAVVVGLVVVVAIASQGRRRRD